MPNINQVFLRTIAGIIAVSLIKVGVVDADSHETLTDILVMVITGLGFLLFAVYEIIVLRQKLNKYDTDPVNQPVYVKFIRKVIDKIFVIPPKEVS